MDEKQMREMFRHEQGCRMVLNSPSGGSTCAGEIKATDADAAVTGLALLCIRLAEMCGVSAEAVLGHLAVKIVEIGERVNEECRMTPAHPGDCHTSVRTTTRQESPVQPCGASGSQ